MQLFGHELIQSPQFYAITSIDAIKETPPNATLYIDYSDKMVELINYCNANKLSYALYVKSLRDVILAHNFGAAYIIVDDALVKLAQKAADDYLFDAKILCKIEHEESIETLATLAVDGAIFPKAIVTI